MKLKSGVRPRGLRLYVTTAFASSRFVHLYARKNALGVLSDEWLMCTKQELRKMGCRVPRKGEILTIELLATEMASEKKT